jgi:hypothetical protein
MPLRTPVSPVTLTGQTGRAGARRVQCFDVPRDLALVCVDQKSVNILLATLLRKKDQVAKTVQSNLNQMGARCDLDLNNIVTASLEDLPLEEQQSYKVVQEYMHVQFLADIKKDRSGKVARLKEFELPAIRLNDNNIEVISTVSKKPSPEITPMKSTAGSD